MARLIYTTIQSLDGYIADRDGYFDWAAPSDELHAFINDQVREVGTYLYGRRMYEIMTFWESALSMPDLSPVARDFAQLWQAADKVVYSTTLQEASTARTRLERKFVADEVRALLDRADRPVGIGGATLAGPAFDAGLVDELQLYVVPVIAGGGTPSLQATTRRDLELVDEQRFDDGVVYLRYRDRGAG